MSETPVKVKKTRRKIPVKKLVKWLVILVIVVVVALWAARHFGLIGDQGKDAGRAAGQIEYTTAQVERRSIVSSLSGSGTLQPAASYTVSTLVEGEILSDTFEEGDLVEKDAVLYQVDSSDTANSIERAQISLDQAQRNYQKALDKRTVKADASGQVVSLEVEVGDKVNNNQTIARLRDSSVMTLKIPFPADDAKNFYVGQSAQVTLDGSFEVLNGTVTAVNATDEIAAGNSIQRTVTIEVQNPGGLSTGQVATAVINGVGCAGNGTFSYRSEGTLTATSAGTITAIHISEGSWVNKDQTVLTLGGEDLEDQIQSAKDSLHNNELSMENTRDQLDNYTITSPVTGTVVDKSAKTGDTISGNQALCTIYDLSYLEMTIAIDELDISKVAVGQPVTVTADAVEGRRYIGTVTKVSVVGTTSSGITSYPATIRIDEIDGLLPGMNVDAEIILTQATDVLAIPSSAVNRGNRVLVTADSPSAQNAMEDMEAPEGYVYVQVETGESNDNYIEITSGLQEGDTVAYIGAVASSDNPFAMGGRMGAMGGMPGGFSGGMPAGGNFGAGGGMPAGGGNFNRGGMAGGGGNFGGRGGN